MPPKILVDANIYLDLFGSKDGEKVLLALEEQRAHIFVSQQIVDEVTRRKLEVAQVYLSKNLAEASRTAMPSHLCGEDAARKSNRALGETQSLLRKLANKTLTKISCSEDPLSKRLHSIFKNAVSPTEEELQRVPAGVNRDSQRTPKERV